MKRILLLLSAVILIMVSSSLLVYRFVDVNDYKTNIASAFKQRTGYDINIEGNIRLRLLPNIALDVSNVSVKSVNGDTNEDAILVDQIILHPRFIPLLKKQIHISSLKLVNPVVKFRIFQDGKSNFSQIKSGVADDTGASGEGDKAVAPDDMNAVIRKFINADMVQEIHLNEFSIENGRLKFSDARKNIDAHVDDILCKTSLKPGYNKLQLSGQLKMDVGINTPISISGQYQLAKDFFDFSNISFKLGQIEAHGEAGVDYRSSVPDGKVAFYFQNIDLNPYVGLIDLLNKSKESAIAEDNRLLNEGAAKGSFAWSSNQVDFSVLRSMNGHFSFKSNNIIYKNINVGIVTLNSYLMNGKLTLSLKEAEVFGGNISGEVIVDTTSSATKIRHKINIEDVDLEKISAISNVANIFSGKVNAGIVLTSRGGSQKEIVGNLDGSLGIKIDDGFVRGVDMPGMVRNVASAFIVGEGIEKKTVFKDLSGDFDIKNGTLKTDDVVLTSEIIDFNGYGSLNLPELSINFLMSPKPKHAKDEVDILGGVRVPILVSGSLFQPSLKLQAQNLVEDMVKNPKVTEDIVKQIKNDFENIKGETKNSDAGVVKDLKKILNGF
jgi:AsmA protein